MNRRDFIRRFVLTLLALVFGPRIYQLIDHDELEAFCGFAVDRWPASWAGHTQLTEKLIREISIAIMGQELTDRPDILLVPPHRLEQIREILDDSAP